MVDPIQYGISGASGLLGAFLGLMGFRDRISRLEKEVALAKKTVREGVVWQASCDKCHEGLKNEIKQGFKFVGEKIDNLKTDLKNGGVL